MSYTPEQFAKLSKWAQSHIESLERKTSDDAKVIERLSDPGSIGNTDTLVYSYGIRPDVKLEKGSVIQFKLPGDDIECSVRNAYLYVTSNHDSLIVQPQSSNVVRIRVGEYWR